jgi:hypothetical protein
MKVKEKVCRGTGKAAGYGCGELSLMRKYGLCLSDCYPKWLYNSDEGKEMLSKTLKIVQAPRKSLEKAIEKDKESSKIQAALVNTKTQVHKMVHIRDVGKPCISCGMEWKDDFDAGHCYAVNNYRSIRFEFLNIHLQCRFCNRMKDGRHDDYILRLPDRIGQENFERLQKLAILDKKFNKHWTRQELSEIRKEARKIIKQIQ